MTAGLAMMRVPLMVALLAASESATAQPRGGAVLDVLAGVEGGGRGYAAGARRTRTTLRMGLVGWLDEAPAHMLALAAVVEVEPIPAIGADFRYQHRFVEDLVVHLGVTSILAPGQLVGASTGFTYQVAIGEHFSIAFGPTANVYFAGDDLADEVILWQAVIGGGARVWF
jgi:hypothetical protein